MHNLYIKIAYLSGKKCFFLSFDVQYLKNSDLKKNRFQTNNKQTKKQYCDSTGFVRVKDFWGVPKERIQEIFPPMGNNYKFYEFSFARMVVTRPWL